jgi:hypothetical protein
MVEQNVSATPAQAPLPTIPLFVQFGEAVDVARFFRKRWASSTGADGVTVLPGLETAGAKLPADMDTIILATLEAAQKSHTRYQLVVEPGGGPALRARGEFVLSEITSTLEWHFDDDIEDDDDARLANLTELHGALGDSSDAMALALEDFATLAAPHRDAINGLGGFDAALIDEAPRLAAELRALPRTRERTPEAAAALADRNAKVAALYALVRTTRAAARFVFRAHPDIVREATSAWERKRRAAARRAALKPKDPPS